MSKEIGSQQEGWGLVNLVNQLQGEDYMSTIYVSFVLNNLPKWNTLQSLMVQWEAIETKKEANPNHPML